MKKIAMFIWPQTAFVQITLQAYLHSETFNLGRHLEVTCTARYRFLDHWHTTFKRCSQSIASVRLLSPFKMSDFRTIAFVLHLEQVSGEGRVTMRRGSIRGNYLIKENNLRGGSWLIWGQPSLIIIVGKWVREHW